MVVFPQRVPYFFNPFCEVESLQGKGVWRWQEVENVRVAKVQKSEERHSPGLLSCSSSFHTLSNPRPLKTSRRPLLLMTRLSNPIAVAQTQSSALNPLESDCSSRVKLLRLHCHSLGHRHCYTTCSELLKREPSQPPDWPTYTGSHIHAIGHRPEGKT